MSLTSSFSAPFHFILMEGFDDFCFCSFAPNFTHSTKIIIKFVKPHGQNSLLYVPEELLFTFYHNEKKGKII